MKPIKDRTYRAFCAACLILAVMGMCTGMIVQMSLDWREFGPLPALVPLVFFSIPGLIYPILSKIGWVDGFYKYDEDEIGALEEFHKDIRRR